MKRKIFISTIVLLGTLTSCSEHKYPDLGDGYKFETGDGNSLEIVNFENTVVVGTEILDYAFDSTFIAVSQRPWDVPDVPGIIEMTYDKRNEAFENSKFLQYWIINKKEKGESSLDTLTKLAKYSNVYGPFQKQEYLQKREELGIPKELKLKE
jgi:hypothetical protein